MRTKVTLGITIGFLIGVLFSAGAIVLAGALDPTGGPTADTSQMYTLQQIYEQLTTGSTDGKMVAFTEPVSSPGTGTMVTLDEIMDAAPSIQTNAATQDEVVSGSVVWGLSEADWGLIEGSRPYLPVSKTGQATCYETTGSYIPCVCGSWEYCPAGQDGDWQRGLAPMPPASRFTVISGTVTDNMTGLVWLQNAHCPGPNDETYTGMNWIDALANVARLNDTGQMLGTDSTLRGCGDTSNGGSHQTDWRLPNVRELLSLVDYSRYAPCLPDGHPFDPIWPRWYWSSTTHPEALFWTEAWFVSMHGGRVQHIGKDAIRGPELSVNGFKLYVWAVRGGQE